MLAWVDVDGTRYPCLVDEGTQELSIGSCVLVWLLGHLNLDPYNRDCWSLADDRIVLLRSLAASSPGAGGREARVIVKGRVSDDSFSIHVDQFSRLLMQGGSLKGTIRDEQGHAIVWWAWYLEDQAKRAERVNARK